MTMTDLKLSEERAADFALKISDDSLEPYVKRGETVTVKSCATIRDGDVGLFFAGSEIVCRQYCQDYAGNVYLFLPNRKRAAEDLLIPASAGVPISCFGKILLDTEIPLP